MERRRANKRGDAKSRGDEYEDENEGGVGGIHRLANTAEIESTRSADKAVNMRLSPLGIERRYSRGPNRNEGNGRINDTRKHPHAFFSLSLSLSKILCYYY